MSEGIDFFLPITNSLQSELPQVITGCNNGFANNSEDVSTELCNQQSLYGLLEKAGYDRSLELLENTLSVIHKVPIHYRWPRLLEMYVEIVRYWATDN